MARRSGFIRRQIYARPLASTSVAFLAGLIIARRWPVPMTVCACIAPVTLAVCVVLYRKNGHLFMALVMILAAVLGTLRMTAALDAVPTVETRYSVEMTGWIVSEPYTNPDTGRVISRFRVETIDGEPSELLLRLYLRGEPEPLTAIDYGQRLTLTGHIWRPDPVTNPYQFDFGDYLRRDGMAGYATAKIEETTIAETKADLQSVIIRARRALARRIDALFPQNSALVRALLLGDRSLLSEEMREAMSRTGTAHLISISGLHVTVLSMLLALLLRQFMSRSRANALTLVALIPYGALIGFSAPFVRALLMFAIFSFAPIAGYPSDPITRLCAAMLAYLLARPMDIGDAGFVLSFSASAGILLLMPPLTQLLRIRALRSRKPPAGRFRRRMRRLLLYFPTLLCASLAAQLATLPAVVAYFGVQSIVSLPFNLICVPLCMLGYLGALIALAVSVLAMPAGMLLARISDGLFAWLTSVTRFSAALPQTVVRVGRYPAILILVHGIVILAASELSRLRLRLRKLLPLSLVLIAGLSSLLTFARAWDFSVVFLDAGQADCAIVQHHGHTWMIDAGDTYTPAADYLSAACLHLDGVVLSHPHQDHAGGLIDVLTAFKPDAIYVPAGWFDQEEVSSAVIEGMEMAESMRVPVIELALGDAIDLSDGATLTVYSPDATNLPSDANDLSLLTLVECEGQRALFTGDLTMNGEPETIPDTDILKVAHHGSAKATSDRFLEASTPQIAVISVGENNYGHPSDDTLKKLESAGADIYQTRSSGAVTMTFRRGEWHIDTYLEAADELE